MPTREIASQEWLAFCDEFSKNHPGTKATLQVIGSDVGAQEEAHELPFVGISADIKGSGRGSITILLGTEPNDHVERLIPDPKHVWLKTADDGQSDSIVIESSDGNKTILQLQPLSALPK